jgi:hypothetical protein
VKYGKVRRGNACRQGERRCGSLQGCHRHPNRTPSSNRVLALSGLASHLARNFMFSLEMPKMARNSNLSSRTFWFSRNETLMTASVYIAQTTPAKTTLDVGRHNRMAEIDVPSLRENSDILPHYQARYELTKILHNSQFKNMVADGSIRMEPDITIANVVKEVMRALHEPDGVAAASRS